jgi:hypothetical protein
LISPLSLRAKLGDDFLKDTTSTEEVPFEAFFSCWWSFFYHLGEKGGGKEEGCICMP